MDRRVRPGPGRPRTRRRRPGGRPRRGRLPHATTTVGGPRRTAQRVDRTAHRAPATRTPAGTARARPGTGRLGDTLPTGPGAARDRARRRPHRARTGRPELHRLRRHPHRTRRSARRRPASDVGRATGRGRARRPDDRRRTRAGSASTAAECATPSSTSTPGRRPGQRCSPAATSTRARSRPGRSSSAPASNGSPTPSSEHARRLATADHPDHAARLRELHNAREQYEAAAAAYHQTRHNLQQRSHLPVYRHRRRQPAPRAHRAGPGRAAPRPIRRPADRAAHHRPSDHQPPQPAGAAPARPHRLGHRTGPPTSTRRPDHPAQSDHPARPGTRSTTSTTAHPSDANPHRHRTVPRSQQESPTPPRLLGRTDRGRACPTPTPLAPIGVG